MIEDVAVIVESIVEQMDNSFVGKYNVIDGKTYTCHTKWARAGKHATDDLGNVFLINEVEPDEYIVATSLVDPLLKFDGLCFLTPPFWIT